ncbi:hypothetical protein [Streptomyces malaysiensis]|uniref:Uncharacterized protein n=1 Tax=Streptomyces malaysiensis TaxID=92644 RepID=A0A7X5XAA0_STRMQ|nr:hypothetical protein [Streptomyces malaysiensis]NIY68830.1 hypothetical protein [Streptomyces malaysiensis]
MPLLFLNEKSWGSACDPARAERAMADFVAVVRAAAAEGGPGTALVSEVDVKALDIAEGYPVNKWIGASPRNRALWQRLRALQGRSPVRSVFPADDAADHLEYRHDGEVVLGLGAAHFMDGIAVSLAVGRQWQDDRVTLERSELVEDDDDTLEMRQDAVDVRHLSAEPHLDGHRDWLRAARREGVTTGSRIWDSRADLYPHLTFLQRVEGQLRGLDPHRVVPVRRALERLEEAVAAWDPATMAEPEWRTKVTPEGETRKRVCRFTDLDGETRTFDLHARFTPGAGRIHFRLVPEERTIRLAYIGSKIRPEV